MPIINISEVSFTNESHEIEALQSNKLLASIGKGTYVVDVSLECGDLNKAHILIGNYCSIAHKVVALIRMNHSYTTVGTFAANSLFGADIPLAIDKVNHNQIVIGHEVWIGRGAVIFGGVHIGNGAIIGANAVITKDVPPYAIVVGNPGRIVKYRFTEEIIADLQRIKWWYWDELKIKAAIPDMGDPEAFVNKYRCAVVREETTESAEVENLRAIRDAGYVVAGMEFDSYLKDPLSFDFVRRYCERYNAEANIVLMLFIDGSRVTDNALIRLQSILDGYGDNAPIVFIHDYIPESMPEAILDTITHFYFTKSGINSRFFDYLSTDNVVFKYVLDDDIWPDIS